MRKPTVSPLQTRTALIALHPDGEAVRITAALSSAEPVQRPWGLEVLRHDADAIDMSRASRGLPLTVNHSERNPTSPDLPVGRVVGISLGPDARLRGDLDFDTDDASQAVRGKVARGVAPDVSLTYRVLEFDGPDDAGRVEITRWQPLAASIVTVPADATVGVGRGDELTPETEAPMPDETNREAPEASSIIDTVQARTGAGFAAGQSAENERLGAIQTLTAQITRAQPHLADQLAALEAEARADVAIDADRYRSLVLELLGAAATPLNPPAPRAEPGAHALTVPGDSRRPLVSGGTDAADAAARGIELALLERAGGEVTAEQSRGNRYRGWSILDCAREILTLHGTDCRGLSSEQIAKAAIGMRAISPGTANYVTSDFPAVTENVITKRVHDAYMEAEVTWERWCSTYEVPDFKQFSVPRLSQVSSLPVVAENAAYANLTQADAKESATLVKHGGLLSFSWEAMVNDDAGMFSRSAARMGEAAARTVDENAYAVLTVNKGAGPVAGPVMGDGNQLFSAAHSNVGTAALDLTGIVAARTAIARQTDENSVLLGLILRHLIVPEELRDAAENLAGAEHIPWEEGGTPQTTRVNTVRGTFQVTATVRLTDANDWFAASAAGGTVEVAFLNGNRNPMLERDQGWDTDAMHFKVRHPHIAYPVDWRGVYWNEVT